MVRTLSRLTFLLVFFASTMAFAAQTAAEKSKNSTAKRTTAAKAKTTAKASIAKPTAFMATKPLPKKIKVGAKIEPLKRTGPFTMLRFEQIARLEFTQRVKYIRTLRQAFIDIEKTQNMYRLKEVAGLDMPPRGRFEELYAFLFGQFAGAAAGRGMNREGISDHCIHSYNLQLYPRQSEGGMQKFQCPKVPCKNGGGVQCGEFMSGMGLTGASANHCIADNVSWNGTQECDKLRKSFAEADAEKVRNAVEASMKAFGSQGAPVTEEFMKSQEAAEIIKHLAEMAFSDEAYAQLIYILALYKKKGLQIPNMDILAEHFAALQPDAASGQFDSIQQIVNGIFGSYIAHCNDDVDLKVMQDLYRESKMAPAKFKAQMGRDAHTLEQERVDALKNYTDQLEAEGIDITKYTGGSLPPCKNCKVKDILETRECPAIEARVVSIGKELQKIENSYPEPLVGMKMTDDSQIQSIPQADSDKIDPLYDMDETVGTPFVPYSTGCNTDVTLDEDQLEQIAPRCSICLAERSMYKYNGESFSASTKWASLLSTMALACGDGVSDSTYLMPEMMLQYQQTFGECSASTYDWDPGHCANKECTEYTTNMPLEDKLLVRSWNKNEFWRKGTIKDPRTLWQKITRQTPKASDDIPEQSDSFWQKLFGKTPKPDIDPENKRGSDDMGDFERIYGVSYEMATEIFCDPKRFSKGVLNGDIRNYNDKYQRPSEDEYKIAGRVRFNDFIASKNAKKLDNPHSKALLDCLQESAYWAKKRYSGGDKKTCSRVHKFDTAGWENAWDNSVEDITAPTRVKRNPDGTPVLRDPNDDRTYEPDPGRGGTTMVWNGGVCNIAAQWQQTPPPDNAQIAIAMMDPSRVSHGSLKRQPVSSVILTNRTYQTPPMIAYRRGDTAGAILLGREETMSSFSFSTPDDRACEIYQKACSRSHNACDTGADPAAVTRLKADWKRQEEYRQQQETLKRKNK